MESTLAFSEPLARRLTAWARERFPADNILVSSVLYLAALLTARASLGEEPVAFGPADIVGFTGAVGFFLMLRVFDEHKDYAADVRNYPERVLSRGLVTLDHLKVVGAFAIGCQLLAAVVADGGVGRATWLWLALFGYSLLMLKEFFVGDWLDKRLWLYATTHMLVTPLAMLWFAQMGVGQGPLPSFAPALVALSFAGGAAFEVTRKTRGPDEEREEVASYSRDLGRGGAVLTVWIAVAIATASAAWLLFALGSSVPLWSTGSLLASTLLAWVSLLAFARRPSERARRRNEKMVGLFLLTAHVCLVARVIGERGMVWH